MNIQLPKTQKINMDDIVPMPNNETTINSIGAISKKVKANIHRSIYKEFFRKRFQVPSTHHDPRVYSYVELLNHIDSGKPIATSDAVILRSQGKNVKSYTEHYTTNGVRIDEGFNNEAVEIAHDQLSRTNYPTYFMDDQTTEMLINSKLSDSICMDEISFPLPSMVISLPKGKCILPNGSELAAFSITKTYEWLDSTKSYMQDKSLTDALYGSTESWSKLKETAYEKSNKSMQDGEIVPAINVVAVHADMEQSVLRFPISNETFTSLMDIYSDQITVTKDHAVKMAEENYDIDSEAQTTKYIAQLAIKTLLFMEARKDEYSMSQSKVKEERYRRGKLMNEAIWGANFIGKNYGNSLTEKGYGSERVGRTQRYHWRQGHIRGQWYGKGRTKYKTVIIDPYPVNIDDE